MNPKPKTHYTKPKEHDFQWILTTEPMETIMTPPRPIYHTSEEDKAEARRNLEKWLKEHPIPLPKKHIPGMIRDPRPCTIEDLDPPRQD